jgi:hypothetical protein
LLYLYVRLSGERTIEQSIHILIGWFILPLWFAAGFADYLFHRRTQIERFAGVGESLIHHVMLAEVGLPLIVATFFHIDAAVVLLFVLCFVAHEITGNWDMRYAVNHGRYISATETQVHSVLEILPLTAALLVILPHFEQALALVGAGPEHADFSIALKEPPAWRQMLITTGALILFVLGPYTEETIRCLRARRTVTDDALSYASASAAGVAPSSNNASAFAVASAPVSSSGVRSTSTSSPRA